MKRLRGEAYLALTVLPVLVGRVVVHGVGWGGVGRRAVRLGVGQGGHAGQTRQSLQPLGAVTAGRHAAAGLQAPSQRGEGEVTLGLMGHAGWVQQAHHLRTDTEGDQNRISTKYYFKMRRSE